MSRAVNCPVCNGVVSLNASKCPHCGDGFKAHRNTGKVICSMCGGDGKGKISCNNHGEMSASNYCYFCNGHGHLFTCEEIDTRSNNVLRSYGNAPEGRQLPGCKEDIFWAQWGCLIYIIAFVIAAVIIVCYSLY